MDYYLKSEVAQKIRRHPVHVMRLVRQGALPAPVKLTPNGQCLFPKAEIDRRLVEIAASREAPAAA
jgi:predicted DNA-binding transcriptional regulator AlpA